MATVRRAELKFSRVTVEDPKGVYHAKLDASDKAAAIARVLYGSLAQEVMAAFFLDAQLRLIGYLEAARGGIDQTQLDMRVLFRAALVAGATAIILAHNHPSGNLTPSVLDFEVSARVASAGAMLGVQLLDHIVVTDEGHVSCK